VEKENKLATMQLFTTSSARRNYQFFLLLCLVAFILFFSRCSRFDELSWDTGVSAPLLKTTIDITDIVPDTIISGDCQNMAYLDFRQEVYRFSAGSMLDIQDEITSSRFFLPFTVTIQPGQAFIGSDEEASFQFGDAEIRDIGIDSGIIKLTLTNPLKEAVICTWSLPVSDNGAGFFQATVTIPAASNGTPGTIDTWADISGYTIPLTGLSGHDVNRIRVRIDARTNPLGVAVQSTPFDTLKVDARFEQLSIAEAHGYFGKHQVNTGKKVVHISTFDFFNAGSLSLDTASGSLIVKNEIGVDIRMKINTLVVRNTSRNLEYIVQDPFIGQHAYLSRASVDQNSGQVVPNTFEFRFSPATMVSILELLPDELEYDIEMELNPLGNVSFGNDFIMKDHPLTANLLIQMPLGFMAEGLNIRKETSVSIQSPEIREGKLFLIAENRFPFDATISLGMLDKEGTPIDSVKPLGTVAAGNLVLPDLILPVRSVVSFPCDAVRMAKLRKTKKIILDVTLDTKPSGSVVRFKTDYNLRMVISANLETTISL
jgi:hypothetical protein